MAQHNDMHMHQLGETRDIFITGIFSMAAYPAKCLLHIKRVPQLHGVSGQPQCGKLIFLSFTIAFSNHPKLNLSDGSGNSMTAFSAVQAPRRWRVSPLSQCKAALKLNLSKVTARWQACMTTR